MPQIQGFVQRLKLQSGLVLAWAYIGPTQDNTTLLIVMQRSDNPIEVAANASMAEALSGALTSGRQVLATHEDGKAEITLLEVLST